MAPRKETCLAELTSHFFLGENEVSAARRARPTASELQSVVEDERVHERIWDVNENGILLILRRSSKSAFTWKRMFAVARSRSAEREVLFFKSHTLATPKRRERVTSVRALTKEERFGYGISNGFVINQSNFCQCFNTEAEKRWLRAFGEDSPHDEDIPYMWRNEENESEEEDILSYIGEIDFEMNRLEMVDAALLSSLLSANQHSDSSQDEHEEETDDEENDDKDITDDIPSPPRHHFRSNFLKGTRIAKRTARTIKAKASTAPLLHTNLVERMVDALANKQKRMNHSPVQLLSSLFSSASSKTSSLHDPVICRILLLDRTKSTETIRLVSTFQSDPFIFSNADCNIRTRFRCRSALACLKIDVRICPKTVETTPNSFDFPETVRLCRRTIPLSELVHRDAQQKLQTFTNIMTRAFPLISSLYQGFTSSDNAGPRHHIRSEEYSQYHPVQDTRSIKSIVPDSTFDVYDNFHRMKPSIHGGFELADDLSSFKEAPDGWAYYTLAANDAPQPRNTKQKDDLKKFARSLRKERRSGRWGIVQCRIVVKQDTVDILLKRELRKDYPIPDAPSYEKISGYLDRAQALADQMNEHFHDFDDIFNWRNPRNTILLWIFGSSLIIFFGEKYFLALIPCGLLFFMLVTLSDRVAMNRRLVATPSLPLPEKASNLQAQSEYSERPYRPLAFIRLAILEGRNFMVNGATPNPYVQVTYNFPPERSLQPLEIGRTEICYKASNPIWTTVVHPVQSATHERQTRLRFDFMNRSFRPDKHEKKNMERKSIEKRSSDSSSNSKNLDDTLVTVSEPSKVGSLAQLPLRYFRKNLQVLFRPRVKTKVDQIKFTGTWIRDDGGVIANSMRIPVLWPVNERGTKLMQWSESTDELQLDIYSDTKIAKVSTLLGQVKIPVASIPKTPPFVLPSGDRGGWINVDGAHNSSLIGQTLWAATTATSQRASRDEENHGAICINCALEVPVENVVDRHDWSEMYTMESMLEVPTSAENTQIRGRIFQLLSNTYQMAIDNQLALRLNVRYAEQMYGIFTWATPVSSLFVFGGLVFSLYMLIAIPTRMFLLLYLGYLFIDGFLAKRRRRLDGSLQPWERSQRNLAMYQKRTFNLIETIPCAPDLTAAVAEQRNALYSDFTYDCWRAELLSAWSGYLWILRTAHRWSKRYGALRDSRLILWLKRSDALRGANAVHEIPLLRGFTVQQAGSDGRLLILGGLEITDTQARIYNRLGRVATIIDAENEVGSPGAQGNFDMPIDVPQNRLIVGLRTPYEASKLRRALQHEYHINQGVYDFLRRDKKSGNTNKRRQPRSRASKRAFSSALNVGQRNEEEAPAAPSVPSLAAVPE